MLTCLFRKRLRRGQPPIPSLRLRASLTGLSPRLDCGLSARLSCLPPTPVQALYLASECTIASWMRLSIWHWLDVAIFFPAATTTSASPRRTLA